MTPREPWLLHMSDPHLGKASPGQALDHEKAILQQPDLETTQRVFRRTLARLGPFVHEHGKPEVVVVSGDLTYHAHPTGFMAFAELIDAHAELFPDERSRILVVPGNHDVDWQQGAGERQRYQGFLSATRDIGLATPLLDGVDFDADDDFGRLGSQATESPHLIATDSFLVIPINSSNWCGTVVRLKGAWTPAEWTAALASLDEAAREQIVAQVDRLQRHDIARVSRSQIEALGKLSDTLHEPTTRRTGDERIRVVVLHHQLLPVSSREERRSFEALFNLGFVRETLRDWDIDIALHGHKHESGVYWDSLGGEDLQSQSKRVLVLSSPGHFRVGGPVMRALRLSGRPQARGLRVVTFLGPRSTRGRARVDELPVLPLWAERMAEERRERCLIAASDTHVAYARLQSLLELGAPARQVRNLVCQIDDPAKADQLPPGYPRVPGHDPQAWFEDLVHWWQGERSELVDRGLVSFNHGERIRRRWGNQIERAVRLLDEKTTSSRALIELVAPGETGRHAGDQRDLEQGSFPAFVLAELAIIERGGAQHLDCFGYFRKQELRYWWPLNVSELAMLQAEVRGKLKDTPELGRLVTFSAIALWGKALPRVAVPEIDRLVDSPERLWDLAAAFGTSDPPSDQARRDWHRVLDDLRGDGRLTPPQPRLGLERLAGDLEKVARLCPTDREPQNVLDALRLLMDHQAMLPDTEPLKPKAIAKTEELVAALRSAVEAGIGEIPDDD